MLAAKLLRLAVHCLALMRLAGLGVAINPSPIVLVPAIMGCQLSVIDNGGPTACRTGNKYKRLWFDPFRMVFNTICTKRELPLHYDSSTDSFHNNTHVKISVPGFGGTSTVEFLNPYVGLSIVGYMYTLVQYFVDLGYVRGKTIRAAPYDWRLAPDELEKRGYYDQLKILVEEMYKSSGKTRVTIVAHSMGGPISLHFLTGFKGINQAWKDKYLHAYIPLSGNWAGSLPVLQTAVSSTHKIPDNVLFASDLINNFVVPLARTFESIPWVIPQPSAYGDNVLISTPSKDYTANDYADLFQKIGYTNGYRFFQRVQTINSGYPAPNVPTYCFYGIGVETPSKYTYSEDFVSGQSTIGLPISKIEYSETGDDSVNIESSRICHRWISMPFKYPFKYKTYDGVNHLNMVKDSNVLNDIALIVKASNGNEVSPNTSFMDWLSSLFLELSIASYEIFEKLMS